MSEEILDLLDRLTDAYWSGDGNPELYSALEEKIKAVCAENERLRQVCRDAYEVWAGSEGIPQPETAAEAYLLDLLMKMVDEVRRGLK